MNNKFISIITFGVGGIIGTAIAWVIADKKYKKIADEEIKSVKETYTKMRKKDIEERLKDIEDAKERLNSVISEDDESSVISSKDKADYDKIITENNYTSYYSAIFSGSSTNETYEIGGEDMKNDRPYVIPPDEFGDYPDYETISLTYYNDKVLTDENNEIVDNIDELIGEDSLTHFGEYEDDSVFVRNDSLKSDYEILLDSANYSDIMSGDQVYD